MTTAMIFIAAAGIAVAALVFKDPLLRVVGLKPAADTSVSQGDNGGGGNAAIGDDATKPSATQPSDGSGKTPRSSEPIDRNPADDAVTENGSRPRVAPGDADAAAKRSADSAAIPPLPGENLPPSDADAGDKPTGDEPSGDEPPPAPTPPGDAAVPGEAPKQPAVAPRLDRAEPVGKLVSGDQLLLRFDTQAGEGGDWVRVPDGGMVYGGDRIVALPTYRPRLVLGERLLVELVADGHDGTIVDVLAPDAEGTPSLRVVHGRLAKISATGRQSVALRFVFGKQAATATLANATTSLAVLVDRPYAPGEDPMAIADPITATFFATSGTVDVAVEGAPPVAVNEAMQLAVSPAGPSKPAPTSPPPQWVDKSQIGFLEARAASQLMQELTPTASVGLELSEQFHGRRIEDQSFAARSFGYLGRFDPLVTTALKDESLAWTWREKSLEGLRLAMRRGPSTASSVRDALVKEFGDRNGGVMYRMLCGYSPADLKNGGDAKLVENLEHEDLPFRALAVFNLSTIAGETLGYMPEARESLRRTWVVRWRERLQRRQIVYDERSARAPRVADAPPTDAAKPAEGRAAPSGVDVGPLGDAAKETPADTPTTPPAPRNAAPNFPPPPPAGPDGR
jgi:hypothetical protein